MIYFIECSGRIKVGFSLNPWARMSKVSADSPFPCALIGVMTGDRRKEALVHAMWHHLHRHGEWFSATEELRAWVGENATERQQPGPEKTKGALCGLPIGHGDKRKIAKACGITAPAVTQRISPLSSKPFSRSATKSVRSKVYDCVSRRTEGSLH